MHGNANIKTVYKFVFKLTSCQLKFRKLPTNFAGCPHYLSHINKTSELFRQTKWQSPLKIQWQILLINALERLRVLKEDCG